MLDDLSLPVDVPGLSSAHNLSADEPGVVVRSHQGGTLSQVEFPVGKRPQVGGGLKKPVTEFSRKSRREMLNSLNSLNRNKIKFLPLFITLTYPDQFPRDKESWTEHFNRRFRRRFERKFGRLGGYWRKEFKERKTGDSGGPGLHTSICSSSPIRLPLRCTSGSPAPGTSRAGRSRRSI